MSDGSGRFHNWLGFVIATVAARLLARPILQEYATFKSVAKGLTSGSERIPVGFGKVRLKRGLAALIGEMPAESTIVEEQGSLPGRDNAVDTV